MTEGGIGVNKYISRTVQYIYEGQCDGRWAIFGRCKEVGVIYVDDLKWKRRI